MASLFDGSTEQFRLFVPVNRNYSLKVLLPQLDSVTSDVLPRFLGDEVTSQLLSESAASFAANPVSKKSVQLARSVVARLGFAAYLPFAEVQIDDDGITVSSAEGRKPAFEYQTNKLKKELLETGWRDLDALIQHISKYAGTYEGFENAPYVLEHSQAVYKSPREFSQFYPISESWLTFWALRPFMLPVEEQLLEIVREQIDTLSASISDLQKERIRRNLLRYGALKTIIDALPSLSVEIAGANVQVNFASQYGNATYFTPPSQQTLDWVITKLQTRADETYTQFTDMIQAFQPAVDAGDALGLLDTDLPFVML